eukprot:ctg_2088.g425
MPRFMEDESCRGDGAARDERGARHARSRSKRNASGAGMRLTELAATSPCAQGSWISSTGRECEETRRIVCPASRTPKKSSRSDSDAAPPRQRRSTSRSDPHG